MFLVVGYALGEVSIRGFALGIGAVLSTGARVDSGGRNLCRGGFPGGGRERVAPGQGAEEEGND